LEPKGVENSALTLRTPWNTTNKRKSTVEKVRKAKHSVYRRSSGDQYISDHLVLYSGLRDLRRGLLRGKRIKLPRALYEGSKEDR